MYVRIHCILTKFSLFIKTLDQPTFFLQIEAELLKLKHQFDAALQQSNEFQEHQQEKQRQKIDQDDDEVDPDTLSSLATRNGDQRKGPARPTQVDKLVEGPRSDNFIALA